MRLFLFSIERLSAQWLTPAFPVIAGGIILKSPVCISNGSVAKPINASPSSLNEFNSVGESTITMGFQDRCFDSGAAPRPVVVYSRTELATLHREESVGLSPALSY